MASNPWTERELMAALRAAGWRRMSGPARVYVSPAGAHFHLDACHAEVGVVWRWYAGRRQLPEATVLQPWEMRLREKMREARGE